MSSPRPIPKRAHKKSRTGCKTCKLRKVKVRVALRARSRGVFTNLQHQCDEKRPICGNCAKHFTNIEICDFGRATEIATENSSTASSSSTSNPPVSPLTGVITSPMCIGGSGTDRMLKFQLRLPPAVGAGTLDPFKTYPASNVPDVQMLIHHCRSLSSSWWA
jgi:hypothetical protein